MTTVRMLSSNGKYVGFRVTGHSGYADAGEDILCASITSAVQMTANGITECVRAKAEITVNDADISLKLLDEDKTAQIMLDSFYLHMVALQEQFSSNLKIEISEV